MRFLDIKFFFKLNTLIPGTKQGRKCGKFFVVLRQVRHEFLLLTREIAKEMYYTKVEVQMS